MEEEFVKNQEAQKPNEEKQEEENGKLDELRGTPMGVGERDVCDGSLMHVVQAHSRR